MAEKKKGLSALVSDATRPYFYATEGESRVEKAERLVSEAMSMLYDVMENGRDCIRQDREMMKRLNFLTETLEEVRYELNDATLAGEEIVERASLRE